MADDDNDTNVDELDALLDEPEDPFQESDPDLEVEDGTEDGEGASDDDGGEGAPRSVPYARFKKLVAQRNQERTESAKLKGQLEVAQEFLDTLNGRYKRFKNPAAQLGLDADFMEALEAMAGKDPEAKTLYGKVMKFMETGAMPDTTPTEPKADPRLELILRKEAERTVTDVLAPLGLQTKYEKLIGQHVLQNAKDPTRLDAAEVKSLTRAFMSDMGFTLTDMRKAKVDGGEPSKPKTAHQKAVATRTSAKPKGEEPMKFKSREELLQHREKALSDLMAELETPAA